MEWHTGRGRMLVIVLIGTFLLSLPAAPLYTVRAVGPVNSIATAVAKDGSVAGYSTDEQGTRSAFVFDSVVSVLGSDAAARDTAGGGLAVGNVWTESGARAAIWDGTAVRFLEFAESYALAVNQSDQIAGSAEHDGRTTAFVYSDGAISWIPAGSWSAAYDISNRGQVVGTFQNARGQFRGFSWSAGMGFTELGSLGGGGTWAQAVNDFGAVVGSSTTSAGYLHAFLHLSGMTDLGTLGGTTSAAYDVSGHGDVVGYSFDQDGRSRAFLWRSGMLFDLNQLTDPSEGWMLEAAYGINDSGQIVGTGVWRGERRAFLLNPLRGQVDMTTYGAEASIVSASEVPESAVPEPGTLATVLICTALLLGLRQAASS